MDSTKTKMEMEGLGRRHFIGSVAAAASAAIAGCSKTEKAHEAAYSGEPSPEQWWINGKYVVHRTVNTDRLSEGIVRARLDGGWMDVKVMPLPARFVEWSLSERRTRLKDLAHKGFDPKDLDGPHNACVATYGGWKRDSRFSLNTAYKGMGFVPDRAQIADAIEELNEAARKVVYSGGGFMAQIRKKTAYLAELYSRESRFDLTKQVSLELLTEPNFATHTFLNMMANPIASASFLAYPTYEIRAIPQLLHPDNPNLTSYERNLVSYTNTVHNFVHGGNNVHMACIYHVAEVYDDTPSGTGGGKRIA